MQESARINRVIVHRQSTQKEIQKKIMVVNLPKLATGLHGSRVQSVGFVVVR